MRRLIVMMMAGLLFVGTTGCGGGSDAKDSASGDAKATTTTDDSTDTSEAADSSGSSSASGAVAASVFSSTECQEALQAISAAYGAAGLAMSGQTAEIDKTQKQFDAFAEKAPEAIRGDIETLRDAYGEYGRIISASGWKPGATPPPQSVIDDLQKASDHLDSDEVKSANDRVSAWFTDQCGH